MMGELENLRYFQFIPKKIMEFFKGQDNGSVGFENLPDEKYKIFLNLISPMLEKAN